MKKVFLNTLNYHLSDSNRILWIYRLLILAFWFTNPWNVSNVFFYKFHSCDVLLHVSLSLNYYYSALLNKVLQIYIFFKPWSAVLKFNFHCSCLCFSLILLVYGFKWLGKFDILSHLKIFIFGPMTFIIFSSAHIFLLKKW